MNETYYHAFSPDETRFMIEDKAIGMAEEWMREAKEEDRKGAGDRTKAAYLKWASDQLFGLASYIASMPYGEDREVPDDAEIISIPHFFVEGIPIVESTTTFSPDNGDDPLIINAVRPDLGPHEEVCGEGPCDFSEHDYGLNPSTGSFREDDRYLGEKQW